MNLRQIFECQLLTLITLNKIKSFNDTYPAAIERDETDNYTQPFTLGAWIGYQMAITPRWRAISNAPYDAPILVRCPNGMVINGLKYCIVSTYRVKHHPKHGPQWLDLKGTPLISSGFGDPVSWTPML